MLVAGSYEKFIWGFSLKTLNPKIKSEDDEDSKPDDSNSKSLTLKTLFSYPSHTAPIKTLAVSGPVAVSGGADDAIKIYDLTTCSEIGSVVTTITTTSLAFYSPPSLSFPQNLVAGADDGSVSIYDADPFVLLKTVKVHKRAAVADVAVHRSGRVALSVGRDGGLAMVNLVRGRKSFWCRLDREAGLVRYGMDGEEKFYLGVEEKVTVHDVEDARIMMEMVGKKKILCIAPGEDGLLFTGGEDRCVTAWDTSSGKAAYCIEDAHATRVKGLVVLGNRNVGSNTPYLLASASSDGVIRVWDIRMAASQKQSLVAETDTKSRLSCLAGTSIK